MSNPFIIDDPAQLTDVLGGVVDLQPHRNAPSRSNRRRVAFFEEHQPLPAILSASELLADETIQMPVEVVSGFLHRGSKGVLAAESKTGKTWMLIDLSVSVATGIPWFGLTTTQGRVLLVNFEIQHHHMRNRIRMVMDAKMAAMENPTLLNLNNLDIWTLRGHASPFTKLLPVMSEQIRESNYSLIIIDPIYKGMAGMNENDAGDMGLLMNAFERLAVESGAAVVYVHHFAKGNQAGKQDIDRMSGSGVFARDADSIVMLSRLKPADCFQLKMIVRNHPPQPVSAVRWVFPLMHPAPDVDPYDLQGRSGRPKTANENANKIITLLDNGALTYTAWKKLSLERFGFKKGKFDKAREFLVDEGLVEENEGKWRIKPEQADNSTADFAPDDDFPKPPPTQPVKVIIQAG